MWTITIMEVSIGGYGKGFVIKCLQSKLFFFHLKAILFSLSIQSFWVVSWSPTSTVCSVDDPQIYTASADLLSSCRILPFA